MHLAILVHACLYISFAHMHIGSVELDLRLSFDRMSNKMFFDVTANLKLYRL